MGVSAFIQAELPTRTETPAWTRTDGNDFASVLSFPRCRELLEKHVGIDLGAVLECDGGWHAPADVYLALDALFGALPSHGSGEWSEDDGDRWGYLYAELSGDLADFEYFYAGYFVADLFDLGVAVLAADAERVRLVIA